MRGVQQIQARRGDAGWAAPLPPLLWRARRADHVVHGAELHGSRAARGRRAGGRAAAERKGERAGARLCVLSCCQMLRRTAARLSSSLPGAQPSAPLPPARRLALTTAAQGSGLHFRLEWLLMGGTMAGASPRAPASPHISARAVLTATATAGPGGVSHQWQKRAQAAVGATVRWVPCCGLGRCAWFMGGEGA